MSWKDEEKTVYPDDASADDATSPINPKKSKVNKSPEQIQAEKENRQHIKLQCLGMANNLGDDPSSVVARAKAYYDFVR